MYDIFLAEDVRKLMKMKSIVFLGDSNVRALYKDFLCLLRESRFISQSILRNKMENAVFGDRLVYHGKKTNGRCYREEREAFINNAFVSFFFLTKVYDDYVEDVLKRITEVSRPDVIIINSCVWDITRWGCDGVYHYKENLRYLMMKFRQLLPSCLIIWVTTPPLAAEVRGGFLVKELQFLKYSLRFHVVEANHFAKKVVVDNGFDVLDTHFHLQMQIHRRSRDGIHWEPKAVRYITNLILRHISLSWDVPLPHRYESTVVDENLISPEDANEDTKNPNTIKLETKKKAVDVKRVRLMDSDVPKPSERLQSTVAVVTKQEETKKKRRDSIKLYRVPKKEESIHNHMARVEKKARHKRIHRWKQPVLGDSPQFHAHSFKRKSRRKKSTNNKQRLPHKAHLSHDSFEQNLNPTTFSTPVRNSLKAPLRKSHHCNFSSITSPSQIPLPSYSPGYQQVHNLHLQRDESQPPLFSRSDDFTLITSPSQIPLPPYSPGHPEPNGNHIRRDEFQHLTYDRSVHFDFPITSPSQIPLPLYNPCHNQLENIPPQRHVTDYERACRPMPAFADNGNRASDFLNHQSGQCNRIFETVNNSVVPDKFQHGQIFQPRFEFVNDEIPQIYQF